MKRDRAAAAAAAGSTASSSAAAAAAGDSRALSLHLVQVPLGAPALDPSGASPRALLSAFTHGLGADPFLSSHYRHGHAVAVVGGGAARVARITEDLFCAGSIRALAASTASERIHAWLPGGGVEASGGRSTLDSLKLEDAGAAMTAYNAGGSLYMRSSPEAALALVPRFAEAVNGSTASYYAPGQAEPRGEVEVLASRKGHKTFWHSDFQENFTLQLRGSKAWRLVRAATRSPVRGATPHFVTPSDLVEAQVKAHRSAGDASFAFWPGSDYFSSAASVTLVPGDLLYFPAGGYGATG